MIIRIAFLILFLVGLIPVSDWPQFRGPRGQGISTEQNLPLTWSESKNVRWKTAIPGRELKHLATNQLDGPTLASMAVSHNSLFIRSATHLYRISN